jgi:hypothetical protein
MIGALMARTTRSGTAVGPGICKKWRPACREEFVLIGIGFRLEEDPEAAGVDVIYEGSMPGAAGRHELRMRKPVKAIAVGQSPSNNPL